MSELFANQLLLLSNLIYLPGVVKSTHGETVSEIVTHLLSKYKNQNETVECPCEMERDEWVQVLTHISQNPELMELKIVDGLDEYRTKPGGGMTVACFVDSQNNATVVFYGTGGDDEWHDNGEGGYSSETVLQVRALEWFENLPGSSWSNTQLLLPLYSTIGIIAGSL